MLVYLAALDSLENRDVFQRLYTRYRGLMFRVARQILHNDQDAEDAVHNAFLALVDHVQKISDPDSPKTRAFVVTIVEHKAIDLYRQKARRPTQELWEEAQGIAVPYDGDDGLARCILALPARYRDWILLKYDQGYSTKELARLLGLSMDAAYKLDRRAKEKLEALCREEGLL